MLGKERYKKADVLVISDFIMSNNLSKNILDALHLCRQQGNRFNSLIIGSYFMNQKLPTHFDREWVYNPQNQSIDELVHSINVN